MSALAPYYLIIKGLHVAFMVTWFAGLFYLPRLFIYHNDAEDEVSQQRFVVMERRLFVMMTLGATMTAVFGLLLLAINPVLLKLSWMQLKLLLILALAGHHVACYRYMVKFRDAAFSTSSRGLRWFNEIPVVFLFAIVLTVIIKAT